MNLNPMTTNTAGKERNSPKLKINLITQSNLFWAYRRLGACSEWAARPFI